MSMRTRRLRVRTPLNPGMCSSSTPKHLAACREPGKESDATSVDWVAQQAHGHHTNTTVLKLNVYTADVTIGLARKRPTAAWFIKVTSDLPAPKSWTHFDLFDENRFTSSLQMSTLVVPCATRP